MEYALEAVKQGSAAVGLKSKTHAVLLALKVSLSFTTLALLTHYWSIIRVLLLTKRHELFFFFRGRQENWRRINKRCFG